jgi:hypothetical protein
MTTTPRPTGEPVDPARIRVLTRPFAWIDVRLRERLHELSLEETALLFFLHIVADRQGLSFWADSTIAGKLGLKEGEVIQARYALVSRGLIAYRYPLFQLLPLSERGEK